MTQSEWQQIIELIKSAKIHKLYSLDGGFAMLTDRNGKRDIIIEGMSCGEVEQIIASIKKTYS